MYLPTILAVGMISLIAGVAKRVVTLTGVPGGGSLMLGDLNN